MKSKTIIIVSIIVGLVTIALALISGIESIGFELPFYILVAPAVLWCVIILPVLINKKNDSDKE